MLRRRRCDQVIYHVHVLRRYGPGTELIIEKRRPLPASRSGGGTAGRSTGGSRRTRLGQSDLSKVDYALDNTAAKTGMDNSPPDTPGEVLFRRTLLRSGGALEFFQRL